MDSATASIASCATDPGHARVSEESSRDVAAARAGDRDAYGRLYERHRRAVHGLLLAHGRRADVDDLLQEAFLIGWRELGGLRDAHAFAPWIARIARRLAGRARRTARLAEHAIDTALEPVARDATDAGADGATLDVVLSEIGALPASYREALLLRLVEDLSPAEIAAALGRSPGAVRVHLHRGMQRLRTRLVRRGIEP